MMSKPQNVHYILCGGVNQTVREILVFHIFTHTRGLIATQSAHGTLKPVNIPTLRTYVPGLG